MCVTYLKKTGKFCEKYEKEELSKYTGHAMCLTGMTKYF